MFELKFSTFFRFNVLQAHLPECSEKFFFSKPRQCKYITNVNFCQLFLQKLQRKIRHFFALLFMQNSKHSKESAIRSFYRYEQTRIKTYLTRITWI